jgi:hypothetical protein
VSLWVLYLYWVYELLSVMLTRFSQLPSSGVGERVEIVTGTPLPHLYQLELLLTLFLALVPRNYYISSLDSAELDSWLEALQVFPQSCFPLSCDFVSLLGVVMLEYSSMF